MSRKDTALAEDIMLDLLILLSPTILIGLWLIVRDCRRGAANRKARAATAPAARLEPEAPAPRTERAERAEPVVARQEPLSEPAPMFVSTRNQEAAAEPEDAVSVGETAAVTENQAPKS